MEDAAELLSPPEADWPPELRLPPPPPPPSEPEPDPPPAGPAQPMDDSQFLGSIIMGDPQPAEQAPAPHTQAPQPQGAPKKKRGRPPKNRDGAAVVAAAPKPAPAKKTKVEDEEEIVCFICFDGGDLVLCDRRGCPKVYHPVCIKRDAAFFNSRSKWNCGWHICSSCEKAVHYMCYTCTYSACKVCIKQGKFFGVRGTKGFCDTCFGTILLIESKDEGGTEVKVDFDDRNSWEYLFKLYWLDLKGKLSLTMEEVTSAKSRWNVPNTFARKEKDDSSDDLYDANNDDGGSDGSSGKRKRTNSSRKRGRKRQTANSDCGFVAKKVEVANGDAGSVPKKEPSEGVFLPLDTKWASPELMEFVGHMRDGDQSFISQFDVQTLLLEYIKKNNLRDPRRKSQIICDSRLHSLFRKTRVAHFEMLKLLEMHFLVNEASTVNNDSQNAFNPSAQIDASGYSDVTEKSCPDRKRRMHRKMEREQLANFKDYAAIDMHNINLIYLRRSVMEDLVDDSAFSEKIAGGFVRIKISGLGHKQDMYRLVKVIGTHKVSKTYNIGKKTTNFALEILNLNKKEIITMDTISNQDFTEEECKRLRQSMKFGLISRLKVGDIQERAKIFQSVRVNDWLENEKQRLGHLRDRASETGRRKELRECVEKLQLLETSEERTRRVNEVLEVHVDSHMDPDYESDEEVDDTKADQRNAIRRSDAFFSPKAKCSNTPQNHAQKASDASRHPTNLCKQVTIHKLGAGRNSENFNSLAGTDVAKPGSNVNGKVCEAAASISSSEVTLSTDMEPEKVWHYKDPSGNVQGPFTLSQLSKWTTYFPQYLRVWLTFESEERSLLLTEVLSKQPKDFGQSAAVTCSKTTLAGSGQNGNSPNVDLNKALSPVGYSMLNSSEITIQSTKYSVRERESGNSLEDTSSVSASSVPPKDADTSNSQVKYRTKHSGFLPSPESPYVQSDLHHDGVQVRCSDEWSNRHSGGLWSPTMPQTSCSGQSSVESHHNHRTSRSKVQHDSKSSLQAGFVKDQDSRHDYSQNIPSQLIRRDVPSPVNHDYSSPCESRTASSQYESPYLSLGTNPGFHDELHSSVASEKAKSCAQATSVEDRGSSSPSGMPSHSERVPVCSPQLAPSASVSDICKMEDIMNRPKTLEAEASNASVNQSPQSEIFPDSSPDDQDIEREYPSPTPRSESKDKEPIPSEKVPVCSPQLTPSASVSGICKMEIINLQKPLGADASNASVSQFPNSEIVPDSSPDNQVIERGDPSPTPRTDCKEPSHSERLPSNSEIVTVCSPEFVPSASVSVICKMEEIMNRKELTADASNASVYQSHQPDIIPVSSTDNQETGHDYPSPTTRSESKEPPVDHAGPASVAPENLATKTSDHSPVAFASPQSDPPTGELGGTEASNLERRVSKGHDSNIRKELCSPSTLVTSGNVGADQTSCADSIDLEPVPNPGETDLKGEDSNVQKELYGESTLGVSENVGADHLTSCANSIDLESVPNPEETDLKGEDSNVRKEYGGPTLVTSENMGADPTSCADSIDLESIPNPVETDLKGEDSNVKKESYAESTLVTRGNMVVHPASCAESIDVSDVMESVSNLERTDLKWKCSNSQEDMYNEPNFVTREDTVVDPAPCAEFIDVSDVLESVSNREQTDLKGEDSNIGREMHSESILVTREEMVVNLASCVESIDVSDVLDSLMEQRCESLFMDRSIAKEDFMTTSAEEQPQCSSPIALSPWGESGYYQGDTVDSALWGVQDDPINDMWSLSSPRTAFQYSSGVETDGKGDSHVINPGASTAWGLNEQVKSEPNYVSASSIYGSSGVVGWQLSANGSSNGAWSASQSPNLFSSYETSAPPVKSSHEATWKQERTEMYAANLDGALGNTKSCNQSAGNTNRGSQRSHHRDRYSQISESWLLSSNHFRSSRSDGSGSGGTFPRGQIQRGVCKFHESGYCRKGSSCNYLHTSSLQ